MSHFRVLYADAVKRQMVDLLTQAAAEARLELTGAALRRIDQELRSQPKTFGEFRYLLRHLQLLIYNGAIAPVGVSYGVNEENRFVVIRSFVLMSNIEPDPNA